MTIKHQVKIKSGMKSGDFFLKTIDEKRIAFIKKNKNFVVIELTCPHMGGDLIIYKDEFNDSLHIQCSWHGYIYNINGNFIENPNIFDTLNIRKSNKYFDQEFCNKELKENLKLKILNHEISENYINFEV